MCAFSMVGDHYRDILGDKYPTPQWPKPFVDNPVSRREFDDLRRQVDEMVKLLKRAKKYDIDNNEPNCEMEDKVEFLRNVARLVGVDLDSALK